jgi:hypothetical protein
MIPTEGDRVRMTGLMPGDPDPIPVGLEGTVVDSNPDVDQIYVEWDPDAQGRVRSLILLTTDPFVVLSPRERKGN